MCVCVCVCVCTVRFKIKCLYICLQSVVDHIKVHTEELASEIKEIKDKITSIEQLLQKMAKKQGIHEATE